MARQKPPLIMPHLLVANSETLVPVSSQSHCMANSLASLAEPHRQRRFNIGSTPPSMASYRMYSNYSTLVPYSTVPVRIVAHLLEDALLSYAYGYEYSAKFTCTPCSLNVCHKPELFKGLPSPVPLQLTGFNAPAARQLPVFPHFGRPNTSYLSSSTLVRASWLDAVIILGLRRLSLLQHMLALLSLFDDAIGNA